MNVRKIILFLAALLPLQVMLWSGSPEAIEDVTSALYGKCLDCHGKEGIVISFQNKESVSGYVNKSKLMSSAHAAFACTTCHTEFSDNQHPKRNLQSLQQYKVRASLSCRRCHKDDQILTRPVHNEILTREKEGTPAICVDCHGPHTTVRVKRIKALGNEANLCLRCHQQKVHVKFQNGENLAVSVDPQLLAVSVHNKLSCSDCHYGFSSEDHPKRNFRTRRDMTIASAELCRRCHFDKYTKFQDSIHYVKLSQGNLEAPVCTDCHDSHAISAAGKERFVSASRCKRCHLEIFTVYAKSVHGGAMLNEHNKDVPICVDCHTTHDIKSPHTVEYRERIPELCSKCHANKEIMGKYGLSTDVITSYLSNFHGVTLNFYKKQKNLPLQQMKTIAVCTDCHGIHDINSTVGPDATIVKKNLVQRCRKCHENASDNFPNAWMSHYKPTLQRAPLMFMIDMFYKIFTPIMVIGLVLQILLHIWRYAINR